MLSIMKTKLSLTLLAIVFFAGSSFAQFTIGPKIGVNSSRLTLKDNVSNVEEGSASFGFHAGAFSRITISNFYIQPELLYTSASGELKFKDGALGDQVRSYDFNRIDVPIQVGYKIGDVFRIGAAPIFSVLLSDSEQGDTGSQMTFKNSTVGYQAGIGFDVANLIFDLRYEGNLSGVSDKFLGANTDQRLNQITFAIGIKMF
jgi:hypothetical protein